MSSRADIEPPPSGLDGGSALDLHLWKLPRGRHGLPPELVARSQRERLLAAVVRVAAGKGYLACSVADILKAAGVGRESFYRHFSDKEDCFIAANDMLVDNLERRVAEAYEEPGTWTERVRCSLAATLAWLAANPDVARVMIIEMGTVGPIASVRFGQTLTRLTAVLDDCPDTLGSAPGLPNIASIAAGAVFASVYDKVVSGNTAELAELLPQLTYELLLPYVGDEAASAERAMATEQAEL